MLKSAEVRLFGEIIKEGFCVAKFIRGRNRVIEILKFFKDFSIEQNGCKIPIDKIS